MWHGGAVESLKRVEILILARGSVLLIKNKLILSLFKKNLPDSHCSCHNQRDPKSPVTATTWSSCDRRSLKPDYAARWLTHRDWASRDSCWQCAEWWPFFYFDFSPIFNSFLSFTDLKSNLKFCILNSLIARLWHNHRPVSTGDLALLCNICWTCPLLALFWSAHLVTRHSATVQDRVSYRRGHERWSLWRCGAANSKPDQNCLI